MTAQPTTHNRSLLLGPGGLSAALRYAVAALLSLAALGAAAQGGTTGAQVPDQELRVGYDPYEIHLQDYFPGTHEECIAMSSDESVARVILQGYSVRVIPVGEGTATITVGAIDGGTRTTTTFDVTVNYPKPGIGGPLAGR